MQYNDSNLTNKYFGTICCLNFFHIPYLNTKKKYLKFQKNRQDRKHALLIQNASYVNFCCKSRIKGKFLFSDLRFNFFHPKSKYCFYGLMYFMMSIFQKNWIYQNFHVLSQFDISDSKLKKSSFLLQNYIKRQTRIW